MHKEDINIPTENIIQFNLGKIYIFKLTFETRAVIIEYYEKSSEAEDYLLKKFIGVISEYKNNDNSLVTKDKLVKAIETASIVPGRVKYREE